jgi:DNA-binding MarR family transcriptional regulator
MSAPDTRWLSREQQRSWRAFIIGTTLLTDTLDRELRQAHGLSLGEYEILVRLSESPGRTLRMAEIADSMQHSRSRVTHTVSRMEKAGLVELCAEEGDRRGVEE